MVCQKKRDLMMLWERILCQHISIGVGALIATFWRVLFSASSNNLVQALDQLVELFRRKRLDKIADSFNR